MKKFRKAISILLVMGILLSVTAFPAYASGKITVDGGKVVKVTPPGAGNYTIYGNMTLFGKGNTFDYTLDIPSAGNYHVSVDAKLGPDINLNVIIGGQTYTVKSDSTDRKEFYVGKFNLKAGENTVSVSNSGGGTVWYYATIAEKASDKIETDFSKKDGAYRAYYLPAVIEAEDYDLGAEGSYSSEKPAKTDYRGTTNINVSKNTKGNNVITLRNNDWANYTFRTIAKGSYNVSISANTKSTLELYFDGYEYPVIASLAEGETQIANINLSKGEHTLRVKCTDSIVEIDYISFRSSYTGGKDVSELATVPLTEEEIEAQQKAARPVWKEIWVSASAGEDGDGTEEKPFDSIEKAKAYVRTIRDTMQGDIAVKILPGEYKLDKKILFDENDGGINGYRVIYKGTNSINKPVITGGTKIKGWTPHEEGVWVADASHISDMRTLYINGYAAVRARSKYVYTFGSAYDDPETEYPIDGYYISKLNFPVVSNADDVEILFNQLWTAQRVALKDIRSDENNNWIIVGDQPHFYQGQINYNESLRPLPGSKGYLENAYELIDEPGEFYFNRKTKKIYYYPFPQEDLNSSEVVAGTTEGMFDIMGSDKNKRIEGLSFNNLDFRHFTWLDVSRTGLYTFQADDLIDENQDPNNVQGNGRTMPAAVHIQRARDINFTNCNFQNLGLSAIVMDEHVEDSVIDGNVFRDLSGTGVSVGTWRTNGYEPSDLCEDIEITNNVMHRTGLDYYGSPAVGVYYARRIKTEHNDIMDTPYTGITYGWGWGSKTPILLDCSGHSIRYNRIEDNSNTVKDGGPIYTLGEMKNTFIEYNYLKNSRDFGGIYFDSGSAMMTCRYNVLEDMLQKGNIFALGSLSYGMTVKDNWANLPNAKDSFGATESEIELPKIYEDKNWPAEALDVIANAGLKRGYKRLLTGIEYPSWRKAFYELDNCVDDFYSSVNILTKRCYEYMEGGEGIGYHETREGQTPRLYDLGLNISIGDTVNGEWLAYEVDVPNTGDYQLELCYSYLNDGEANVSSSAGVNIYVDGEKVIDSIPLASTGSWDAYLPLNIGAPIHLEAGKRVIKVEFVNAWAFEKFSLTNTEFKETEPEYDDGIMLR